MEALTANQWLIVALAFLLGLFLGMADTVVVGEAGGVRVLERA